MMKKVWCLFLAAGMVFSLCSCGAAVKTKDLTAQYEPGAVADTGTTPGFDSSLAVDEFAARLLRSQVGSESALVSPVSVLYALGMTMNGADGNTLTQMEHSLGFTRNDLNLFLYAFTQHLPENSDDASVSIANSVWLRDEADRLTVRPDFLQTIRSYYGAGVYAAPFDDGTCRDINNWVQENTDGMIDGILDQIPASAVLYLINALTFDAKWQEPYWDYQVLDGTFTAENGVAQPAQLMYSEEMQYLSGDRATGFIKPYKNGYAFAALLPNAGISVEDYVASLTGEKLRTILNSAENCPVNCALPKFAFDYSAELSDVLSAMGMTDLFDAQRSDLTAMAQSADGNLSVSRVLHKTHIEVDEAGTKVAAVTAVEATDSAMEITDPKEVILDRPFVYMLLDTSTMLPLFIGTAMSVSAS